MINCWLFCNGSILNLEMCSQCDFRFTFYLGMKLHSKFPFVIVNRYDKVVSLHKLVLDGCIITDYIEVCVFGATVSNY